MTPALVSFLQNQLVPAAVERWESALSLQPVVGPLYAHRQCQSTWTTVTPNLCQTYASVTPCADVGDGIVLNIPSSYFGADVIYASDGSTLSTLSAGAGLPNTDFAVCGLSSGARMRRGRLWSTHFGRRMTQIL